ncbi:MAG: NUDIX domain-containing protein [Patescibacteria group bacterium]|jgi:bifunctional NMN adenylyltransferase/nudix hydrolase
MTKKVGVVVARFQVAALHQGHCDLIEYALAQCERVLVVLGIPGSLPTNRNPLEYHMREAMVREAYPEVEIIGLPDQLSDAYWSETLDALIAERCHGCDVVLYGSRDSFFGVYGGHFATEVFEPRCHDNGTSARAQIAERVSVTPDFRAGIIYREETRTPRVYVTVDVAVMNDEGEVLLATKSREQGKKCFVGGFIDPDDTSLEAAASRELHEEVEGLCTEGPFIYIGSTKIDDWRYHGTPDVVMTHMFITHRTWGYAKARDDIDAVAWVPIDEIEAVLADYHLPLGKMLKAYIAK